MKKFRLISKSADGIGLCQRLLSGGHEVDFYLKDENGENLYKGIIERVDDWEKELTKDTILVFDMTGLGKKSDEYKKKGYKVFGASEIADKLELDRSFGIDIARNCGIYVSESQDFQDWNKAIDYVKGSGCSWVFKPEHNKEGIETYVSVDEEDMVEMLENFSGIWKGSVDFILQEVVEGIEVSSEVWVVNGEIVPNSYNNTFETKRFLDGNLSRNTGCMSSTVKFNALPELYDKLFGKLKDWLKLQKFTGPIDINSIIDETGEPYFLEFTPRLGYSAIYAFIELLDIDFGEFVEKIASGEIPEINPTDEWSGSLRVTIPPYPFNENAPETEGKPVRGFSEDDLDHIYLLDVFKLKDKYYTSGFDGIICEVTGTGDTLEDLWESIYDRAGKSINEGLLIPNKQIRLDCLEDVLERTQKLGID
jgi:phosphoribosylamine--glycine ligase